MTPTQRAECYQRQACVLAVALLRIATDADTYTKRSIQQVLKDFAVQTFSAYKKEKFPTVLDLLKEKTS